MQEDSVSTMQIEQFKRKVKDKGVILQSLQEFLGISNCEKSEDIILILKKYNIVTNKCEFREFLETISHLCEIHQSNKDIINKIGSLLNILKEDIKIIFSEIEIFHIFHFNNKYFILLILLEQNILSVETLIKCIDRNDGDIIKYFYPEIREYDEKYLNKLVNYHQLTEFQKEVEKNGHDIDFFYKLRKWEKEPKIIELIREDQIEEFILFVEHSPIDLNDEIQNETMMLITNTEGLTPIEYSALFGSIKIFKYLYLKEDYININSDKTNIIEYAIQGRNYEIIHLLEERKEIKEELNNPKNQLKYLEMSIKMHHNEFLQYFMTNFNFQDTEKIINCLFKSRNYQLLDQLIEKKQIDIKNKTIITTILCGICENGNEEIVKILINQPNIDINSKDEIFDH